MKQFIQTNRVFLSALLSAVLLVVQQFATQPQVNLKAVGFAVFIAVLGVVANQWKGKGVTITGIAGTFAGVALNILQTGTFTWNEFIMSVTIALLTAVSTSLAPTPADAPTNPLPYSNPKQ